MANQAPPPSLDLTGRTAAIYPSEDTLWTLGPPINDPGDQGVEWAGSETGAGAPGAPRSLSDVRDSEDRIHEAMNGETTNEAIEEAWVNLGIYGPAGYGAYNEQPFYSGHTQITVSNPAAEQGWGVGPARRWAHFPVADLPNPFRNRMIHLRNGSLPWVTADSSLYERTQLAWEQQWDPYKYRSPVAPVVNVPQSVPFVATVPTYGGGASPVPGVDVPFVDAGIY